MPSTREVKRLGARHSLLRRRDPLNSLVELCRIRVRPCDALLSDPIRNESLVPQSLGILEDDKALKESNFVLPSPFFSFFPKKPISREKEFWLFHSNCSFRCPFQRFDFYPVVNQIPSDSILL